MDIAVGVLRVENWFSELERSELESPDFIGCRSFRSGWLGGLVGQSVDLWSEDHGFDCRLCLTRILICRGHYSFWVYGFRASEIGSTVRGMSVLEIELQRVSGVWIFKNSNSSLFYNHSVYCSWLMWCVVLSAIRYASDSPIVSPRSEAHSLMISFISPPDFNVFSLSAIHYASDSPIVSPRSEAHS